jgi:GrpB-like predicted nucleotidyltransferase (UPF0157 family)
VTVPEPPSPVSQLPSQPVVIVDYDPRWPELFEAEKARILEACGEWLATVEHIGSTSVPGLAAKPIIDIMPGLRRLEEGRHCIEPMQKLGYQYLGEYGSRNGSISTRVCRAATMSTCSWWGTSIGTGTFCFVIICECTRKPPRGIPH